MESKRFEYRLARSQKGLVVFWAMFGTWFLFGSVAATYQVARMIPMEKTLKDKCGLFAVIIALPLLFGIAAGSYYMLRYYIKARFEVIIGADSAEAIEIVGSRSRSTTVQKDEVARFHIVRTDVVGDDFEDRSTHPGYGIVATTQRELLLVKHLRQEEALQVGESLAGWAGVDLIDHQDEHFEYEIDGEELMWPPRWLKA